MDMRVRHLRRAFERMATDFTIVWAMYGNGLQTGSVRTGTFPGRGRIRKDRMPAAVALLRAVPTSVTNLTAIATATQPGQRIRRIRRQATLGFDVSFPVSRNKMEKWVNLS